jgi:hypothetical protein
MTKNPIVNALIASVYIAAISLIIDLGTKFTPKADFFLAPVAIISLFTLSAAVMGYLFGLQPIQLFIEGKKKEAVAIFLKTVIIFALFTFIELILLFSGVIR